MGASFGAIPATFSVIIANLQDYFRGVQVADFATQGQPIPSLSLAILWAVISSQVCIWLLLIFLSAFSGIFAALIPIKEGPKF